MTAKGMVLKRRNASHEIYVTIDKILTTALQRINPQCKELTETKTWKPAPPLQDMGFCDKIAWPDKISLHCDSTQASSICHPYRSPLWNFRFWEHLTAIHKTYVEREN